MSLVERPPKRRTRRRRRPLVVLGMLVIAIFFAQLGAQGLVASAIAFAPNEYPLQEAKPPLGASERALLGRHESLTFTVGPPNARLAAWVLEPARAGARGTIAVLHGLGGSKREMLGVGRAFADAGYRALLVDLRGQGQSTGRYLTYGVVESRDIEQALDALAARGTRLGPVGVFGYSYGGAVALELAARDPRLGAVVTVSTFATLRSVVDDYAERLLAGLDSVIPEAWTQSAVDEAGDLGDFDPDRASPLRAVRHLKAPLLLFHGTQDERIPFRHALELRRAARVPAELVPIAGATHGSVLGDPVVVRRALDWYARWLPRPVRGGNFTEYAQ
jgi:uncharacterized protein